MKQEKNKKCFLMSKKLQSNFSGKTILIAILIICFFALSCKPERPAWETVPAEKTPVTESEVSVPEGLPVEQQRYFVDNKNQIEGKLTKKELCEDDKRYLQMKVPKKPNLSMPFDLEDHSTKYWGMIPFCAKYTHSGQIHGAMDFELKPNSKVYAAESGVVESTSVGKEEGVGEIIQIKGEGFNIDYSGLKNIQFKAGDKVNKGDHIADAVLIPHGEHHVHMGLIFRGKYECPLKYMDEEFRNAVREIYTKSDFRSQTLDPCACNCESVEKVWN